MLNIAARSIATAARLSASAQSAWHLAMVQRGGYVVELSDGFHEISPGIARISPPGATPWVNIEPGGASCVTVDADGPFWTRVFARISGRPFSETFLSRRRRQACTQSRSTGWRAIGDALTTFWSESRHEDIVAAAREEIEANFRTIALTRLAGDFGISRGRFAAIFLEATGYLPSEYRTLCRVGATRDKLTDASLPLAEISDAVGFADQSHMSTTLKAVLGVSPYVLRHRLGPGAESFSKDTLPVTE